MTLIVSINQKVRCAWCIYTLNCISIDALDAFRVKIPHKQENKVLRGKQPSNNVSLLFLDVKLLEEGYERSFQTL